MPNVPSEILEKQPFSEKNFWKKPKSRSQENNFEQPFSQENNFEKSSSRQENTMALKDELVPQPRQKSA